jgi:hypothetical protein
MKKIDISEVKNVEIVEGKAQISSFLTYFSLFFSHFLPKKSKKRVKIRKMSMDC